MTLFHKHVSAPILIAAGGTGGHVFPALALVESLLKRGHHVIFITDTRGQAFLTEAQQNRMKVVINASAPLSLSKPLKLPHNLFKIAKGIWQAAHLIRTTRARCWVGFGGYPTLPSGLAAALTKTPMILQEQNAILGQANKILARFAKAIALNMPLADGAQKHEAISHIIGMPVRDAVTKLLASPYTAQTEHKTVLVFGGSQGAHYFATLLPEAIKIWDKNNLKIDIIAQIRAEDLQEVRDATQGVSENISMTFEPFFDDLPQRMRNAHLVVSRAGAATVTELKAIGRPSILIPLPDGKDQHANARSLAKLGASKTMLQHKTSPEMLASAIQKLLDDENHLETMAKSAQKAYQTGTEDALVTLIVSNADRGKDRTESTEGTVKQK